jgi:hypothetical protein
LISFWFLRNGIISNTAKFAQNVGIREVRMTITYSWHESYRAALLEADWMRMQERVQQAESEIHKRQRALSEDHGGTPEERQAIADTLNGMKVLRREAAEWRHRQVAEGEITQPETD